VAVDSPGGSFARRVDDVRWTDELSRTIPALAYVQNLFALDRHDRSRGTVVAAC
jgi:hypothetical protein